MIEKRLWCSFIDSREMTTRTRCNCHDHKFLVTLSVFIYEDKYHGETEGKRPLSMVGSPTQKFAMVLATCNLFTVTSRVHQVHIKKTIGHSLFASLETNTIFHS